MKNNERLAYLITAALLLFIALLPTGKPEPVGDAFCFACALGFILAAIAPWEGK